MSNISAATSQASSAIAAAKSQMNIDKMNNAAKTALSEKDMNRINKTAEDFEAVFVTEMLRPMFNMMKVDAEFGGGKGEEVFRDFTLNEYGKKFASLGGLGIAPHVRDQLIRMQSQASGEMPE